jgi:hypothetical protein
VLTVGHHDESVGRLLPYDRLGPFLHEDVMTAFHGERWVSFLGAEGDRTVLHVGALDEDPDGLTSIRTWIGYGDFYLASPDRDSFLGFMRDYSDQVRELGIVDEVSRFDPLLTPPCLPSDDTPALVTGRGIAFVCLDGRPPEHQFNSACHRQIAAARAAGLCFASLTDPTDWAAFRSLLHRSMDRVGAEPYWYLHERTFATLMISPAAALWGVLTPAGEIVSGCLCLTGGAVVEQTLVANLDPGVHRGANDLLNQGVVDLYRRLGYSWLCLGGGRTDASDDSLLRFKRRFSGGVVRRLPLARFVHDRRAIR